MAELDEILNQVAILQSEVYRLRSQMPDDMEFMGAGGARPQIEDGDLPEEVILPRWKFSKYDDTHMTVGDGNWIADTGGVRDPSEVAYIWESDQVEMEEPDVGGYSTIYVQLHRVSGFVQGVLSVHSVGGHYKFGGIIPLNDADNLYELLGSVYKSGGKIVSYTQFKFSDIDKSFYWWIEKDNPSQDAKGLLFPSTWTRWCIAVVRPKHDASGLVIQKIIEFGNDGSSDIEGQLNIPNKNSPYEEVAALVWNSWGVDIANNLTAGTIQADDGYDGTFTDNTGKTVTVVGGIITGVA